MFIDSLTLRVAGIVPWVRLLVPSSVLFVGAGLGALLISWRIWKFTILSILWPDEPKILPYLVPGLGHTWSFMRNPEKLIDNGYKYFGSNLPFVLTVAGKRTVVIRDVQDVSFVWRNTVDLSFDPFVQAVLKSFGIAPSTLEMIFADPKALVREEAKSKSLLINDNPHNKCYMNLERDWFKIQLLQTEKLQELMDRYMLFLSEVLRWENLCSDFIVSSGDDYKVISLQRLVRHTISFSSTSSFFGRRLLEVAPSFGKDYQKFEEESWKIFYRLPQWLAKSSHAAKTKAIDGLERYFLLPKEERSDMTWLFQTMNAELGYLSVPPRDAAGITMIIIWAINNNAHKIAFWMLGHLLFDARFLAALREETDRACSSSGNIDMDMLLTACPHLDAIWYETLRLYNASSVVREALSPCVIGGKTIRKGDTILGPFRQFHLNESIFGVDAQKFNPRRFLENKTLPRTKGYAPFGGGHTYCPGRLFAQREIYLFVAMTLSRFHLQLEPQDSSQMPIVDPNVPSAAAMGPAHDILVRLQPRGNKMSST